MDTYYLQIRVIKSEAEIMEGQDEGIELSFDTEQEVRDAAKGTCTLLFKDRPVRAYLVINRHSATGNEPCSQELIYEDNV